MKFLNKTSVILLLCLFLLSACSQKQIETPSLEILDESYSLLAEEDSFRLVEQNQSTFLVNEKNEILKNYGNAYIVLNYDGYTYNWDSGELTHQGNPTKVILETEHITIYQDATTNAGLVYALSNYTYTSPLRIDEEHIIITSYGDQSYVYMINLLTGEVIHETKGQFAQIKFNYQFSDTYGILYNENGPMLLNKDTFETIGEYPLFINLAPDFNDSYSLYSKQYFPIYASDSEPTQYGLMDAVGNIILPLQANRLYITSSKDDVLVVEKNKRFGLMDLQQNIVLPMEYEFVVSTPNNVIASKNNQLLIYDNQTQLITDKKYVLSPYEYEVFRCCDNNNNFDLKQEEDYVFIKTYDMEHYYSDQENATPQFLHHLLIYNNYVTELAYSLLSGAVKNTNYYYLLDKPSGELQIIDGSNTIIATLQIEVNLNLLSAEKIENEIILEYYLGEFKKLSLPLKK